MKNKAKNTADNAIIKYWVIAFIDTTEDYYVKEILNKDMSLKEFGAVLVFNSEEETKDYIVKKLDSREYDRYPKEITQEEILRYNRELLE